MAIVVGHHAEVYFEDHHVTDVLRRPLNYDSLWADEIKRKEIPGQNVSFPFKRKHRSMSNKHAGHEQ